MSLGAELDADVGVGNADLQAVLALTASMNSLTKELKKTRDLERAYQKGAVEVILRGSAVSNSAGATLIIGLGGPAYGRLWEVRRITCGGAFWTSTVAGQGLLIVSAASGQVTPALGDIVDQAPSLPNVALYGTRQFTVRHPNHVYLVILTPTVSTQYAAGGQATDYPDERVALTTEY